MCVCARCDKTVNFSLIKLAYCGVLALLRITFFLLRHRSAMKFLILILGFVAAANAISIFELVKEEWTAFKVREQNERNDLIFVHKFRTLFLGCENANTPKKAKTISLDTLGWNCVCGPSSGGGVMA